jgi:anti-sigma B factor antagonist
MVPFSLSTVRLGDHAASIGIEGELDVFTAPELEEELRRLGEGVTRVLVDLTGVTFLDSAGVGVLTQNARRLRTADGVMMLAIDTISIRRIFELTGLERYFVIHDEAQAATADLLRSAPASSPSPALS